MAVNTGGSNMALKKVNTEFLAMKDGDTAEGFLVSVGQQFFPPKKGQTEGSTVPTLTLAKKDGSRFKINLGKTVADECANLKLGAWTKAVRPKNKKMSRSGNEFVDWELFQDTDLIMDVA